METQTFEFTPEQLRLIAELLENERRTLSLQTRHSFSHTYRATLQAKLRMVDDLLNQIRQHQPA
ncbi:MAG: hypothetical protein HUU41_15335 [Bryobacteraceae bacterium]|nr:hypothetical protein [Bryobacterales bacterium]MEB2364168.1 hypothetical protein [Bryobacterales bacterium]NUN02485.1 hypothetical protein [Bryobacteraceae bacterium]